MTNIVGVLFWGGEVENGWWEGMERDRWRQHDELNNSLNSLPHNRAVYDPSSYGDGMFQCILKIC